MPHGFMFLYGSQSDIMEYVKQSNALTETEVYARQIPPGLEFSNQRNRRLEAECYLIDSFPKGLKLKFLDYRLSSYVEGFNRPSFARLSGFLSKENDDI